MNIGIITPPHGIPGVTLIINTTSSIINLILTIILLIYYCLILMISLGILIELLKRFSRSRGLFCLLYFLVAEGWNRVIRPIPRWLWLMSFIVATISLAFPLGFGILIMGRIIPTSALHISLPLLKSILWIMGTISIAYSIFLIIGIPLVGLRGLIDVLPALIHQLRSRCQLIRVIPLMHQCLARHFSGDAAQALNRIYLRVTALLFLLLFIIILPQFLITISIITGIISVLIKSPSPSIWVLVAGPLATIKNTVAGLILVVLTIVFSIGSWFVGERAKLSVDTLRIIYDIRSMSLEWFILVLALDIAIMISPPFIALFLIPAIIAITVSTIAYLTLATVVIEYI